jgi:plasmid stabilization system protein ParE
MQIKLDESFENSFDAIFEHIAKDKLSAAKKFQIDLFKIIKQLPHFPYKYRQSFYFDDANIRDMTFKGYTIVYEIDSANEMIILLDIFNRNKPL